MVTAKICGLRTADAVDAALRGGASHIGFMLFDKSPRAITARDAGDIAGPARGRTKLVAVMVDPDDDAVMDAVSALRPDLIQLHGQESPRRTAEIAALSAAGVIKVLPVSRAEDLAAAAPYEPIASHLMFETPPPPGADRPGGHGATFDWSLMKGRRFRRPWFLAGGLGPGNVAAAIAASGAPLVDVSSGVERQRGLKDPALIEAFLAAVRRA